MRELVLFLAKSLVDHPEAVQVLETEGPQAIILELNVAPEEPITSPSTRIGMLTSQETLLNQLP